MSNYWKAFLGLKRDDHDDHDDHDCDCGCGGGCGGAAPTLSSIQDGNAAVMDMAKSTDIDQKSGDGTSEVGFFLPTWLVVVGVIGVFVLVYFRFVHKHVVGTATTV